MKYENFARVWSDLKCPRPAVHTSHRSRVRFPASAVSKTLMFWKSHIFISISFLIEKLCPGTKNEWRKCHVSQCLPFVVKIIQIKEVWTISANSNPCNFFDAKSCLLSTFHWPCFCFFSHYHLTYFIKDLVISGSNAWRESARSKEKCSKNGYFD